jgi:hypothetical protein
VIAERGGTRTRTGGGGGGHGHNAGYQHSDDQDPAVGKDGWVFKEVSVDVNGVKLKRPIRLDKGE